MCKNHRTWDSPSCIITESCCTWCRNLFSQKWLYTKKWLLWCDNMWKLQNFQMPLSLTVPCQRLRVSALFRPRPRQSPIKIHWSLTLRHVSGVPNKMSPDPHVKCSHLFKKFRNFSDFQICSANASFQWAVPVQSFLKNSHRKKKHFWTTAR